MKFKTLNGKERGINIHNYIIDWDGDSLSKSQFKVKQFLKHYWIGHIVLEELTLVGTRLRFDFFNVTRSIAIEYQGQQHQNYIPYFCNNSRSKYLDQIKRDVKKQEWCNINNILLIEIYPKDIDALSPEWFEEKYQISL